MPLTTLGKYELLEELGHGGFGTVYRARETSLEIIRAVKVLHPTLMTASDFIDRFRREGKTTAQLDHPHIVPIYELGEEQGYYYLTMKYMPGGSLKDWLACQGRLPFEQAVEIIQQLAQALEYALEQPERLIHRDIKPGNILFERQPDDPKGAWVRLSDFGFAKALMGGESSSFSASGGIKGTPAYIAPEIWDDQPASPASDQYSLACVFYEMLTGQVLFNGSTPMALMKNVAAGPKFPETWPLSVPSAIKSVLQRALEADPAKRYADMPQFIHACTALPIFIQQSEDKRLAIEQVNLSSQAKTLQESKTYAILEEAQGWASQKSSYNQGLSELKSSKKALPETLNVKSQQNSVQPKAKHRKPYIALLSWVFLSATVLILLGLFFFLGSGLSNFAFESPDKPTVVSAIETFTPNPTQQITFLPTLSAPLTPTYSPTINPTIAFASSILPRLLSPTETVADLEAGKATQLEEMARESYSSEEMAQVDVTFPYTIALSKPKPLLWAWGWCAKDSDTLKSNLDKIKIEFSLNGEPVALEQFAVFEYSTDDERACFAYFAQVTDWGSSEHHLITSVTFTSSINDGSTTYPAGQQVYDYAVYIKP